ncbi:MAG: restriction endonuclease subunit S [Bacteroidota bacterium]
MTITKTGYRQTEVGLIPDDWGFGKIKGFALITTGNKNTQDKIKDGMFPFFVRSQSVEQINSFSFDGEAVLTAGDGVGTGKVFHYINGKFDFHQRVYMIYNFDAHVDGYYFYLQFSTYFYSRIMTMTAKSSVDSVRMEMVADMGIPLPPLSEQRAIAKALSEVDNLIHHLERLIAKKKAIKKGTMQQLLTGKKRLPGFEKEKGYKQTELGLIPKDWEILSFDECFQFLSTANYSRAQLELNENCMYVHYGDIHTRWNHFLDLSVENLPSISKKLATGYHLINEGDLIMADASEDYEGICKCVEAINVKEQEVVSGLHTFLLREKFQIFAAGFKAYFHSNQKIKQQFDRLATGLKVYGVSKTNLKKVLIPTPCLKEQEAITKILMDMERELKAIERKHAKALAFKQGMMQELLTGKTRLPIEE